jgi:hypothetical protein
MTIGESLTIGVLVAGLIYAIVQVVGDWRRKG